MSIRTNKFKLLKDQLRDEFPTNKELAQEIVNYLKGKVSGKSVYCPCDTPESQIYQQLKANFKQLGLTTLIATSYCKDGHGVETTFDGTVEMQTPTKQDGSFDSDESQAIMQQCDVVVTNPPFSRIYDFINLIRKFGKEFLVVVPNILVACRNSILNNHMDIFLDGTLYMITPKNYSVKHRCDDRFAPVNLLSTIPHPIKTIIPYKTIDEVMKSGKAKYIDNYDDVLCIDSMKLIPCNYDRPIALPIAAAHVRIKGWKPVKLMQTSTKCHDDSGWICQCCIVDGKHKFARILMERTQDEN